MPRRANSTPLDRFEKAPQPVPVRRDAVTLPVWRGQGKACGFKALTSLVFRFRSSHHLAATSHANFENIRSTSNFMILVSLIDLKSLGRACSGWCRDFKSAALGQTPT